MSRPTPGRQADKISLLSEMKDQCQPTFLFFKVRPCATRLAPLTAAIATPLTAMLSPPPPSLAAITAVLTFSSASAIAIFAAVVVAAAC